MTLIHSRGKETEGHHFQIHWGTKSRTRRCVFCSLELFLIGHKLWALWRDTLAGWGRLGGYRQMQCLLVSQTQPSSQLSSEYWMEKRRLCCNGSLQVSSSPGITITTQQASKLSNSSVTPRLRNGKLKTENMWASLWKWKHFIYFFSFLK